MKAKRSLLTLLRLAGRRFRQHFTPALADDSIEVIVFSFNRPMQLHALLSSAEQYLSGVDVLTVLWRAGDEHYGRAYEELLAINRRRERYNLICETDFRSDLIAHLRASRSEKVLFLVDDIVFRRLVDLSSLRLIPTRSYVPSIRLGGCISFSQVRDRVVRQPPLRPSPFPGWQEFSWTAADGIDWNMPLSLDGHIFDRKEILTILSSVPFKAPNSMEEAIGRYRFWFKYRKGLCFAEGPAIINFALNRVQIEDYEFPHGETTAEELLRQWEAGQELDYEAMLRFDQRSCHVVVPPEFRPR